MRFGKSRKRGQPGNSGQFAPDVSGKVRYPTAAPEATAARQVTQVQESVSAAYCRFVQEQESRDVAALMSTHTSSEMIEQIYIASPSPYVRGMIAGHPNTTAGTRADLAERFLDEHDVRVNLAGCRLTETAVLAKVVAKAEEVGDVPTLKTAAGHANLDEQSLSRLARHPERGVRVRSVWNPSLPTSEVDSHASDPDPEVRLGVADHPNVSSVMLDRMCDPALEEDSWVRTTAEANLLMRRHGNLAGIH